MAIILTVGVRKLKINVEFEFKLYSKQTNQEI